MCEHLPLFSLIVPVYNVEDYLEQCVQSIIQQTFTDFELILVDDGSPDHCPQICDDLADKDARIRVIHKENGGVSSARYSGLEVARGEYVVCVDADDWITVDCLSSLAKVVSEYDVDIVCYSYFYGRNDGNYAPSKSNYRKGLYSRKNIETDIFPFLIQEKSGTYFNPSLFTKAFKIKLLKKYMLVDRMATIGEDGATVIPCIFHAKSMYMMKECLYYYRYNETSATKGKKPFNWEYPYIISKHIDDCVDMTCGDFKRQLDRKITHDVFNAAKSQFNRKERYSVIAKDIKEHIERPYYASAIKNCKFRLFSKGWFAKQALKYKLIWLIKAFHAMN